MQPASDPDSTFPQNPIPQMFRPIASRNQNAWRRAISRSARLVAIFEVVNANNKQFAVPGFDVPSSNRPLSVNDIREAEY
jgi:hypothetical protein